MRAPAAAKERIAEYRRSPSSSARSLLVTVFGDSIAPAGAAVWIGSIIRLVEPLAINQRLVRTSMNRLTGEGLLETERRGRRSYYAVTGSSRAEFAEAEARIYHRSVTPWDGRWTLVVLLDRAPTDEMTAFCRRLRWLGFAAVTPTVLAAPADREAALAPVVDELGVGHRVAVFRSETVPGVGASDRRLSTAADDVATIDAAYRAFLARYGPLARATDGDFDEEAAFLVRTLLIDDFRRIVLREPDLPIELLPLTWPGDEAFALAGRVYAATCRAALEHLRHVGETPQGPFSPASPPTRFEVLSRASLHESP